MPAVIVIALKDLRQRLRDRSALILGFVAPFLIVGLMNAAFPGTDAFHATLAVVDADGGPAAGAVIGALGSPQLADVVTIRRFDDVAAASADVASGAADAALVLPAGLSSMALGGRAVPIDVLTSVDAELAGEVAHSIATSFTTRIATMRLVGAVAGDAGVPADRVTALVTEAGAAEPAAAVIEQSVGNRPLQGIAYFGPSMATFFVLFAVGFTARGFFLERATGTLDRMAAAPIRPEAILAGKALSVFVYALTSLGTMSVATAVVFGASWGSPVGVAVLCVGMAAAVVSLAALVMALARTERQAESISSALTFVLALLGGSFLFIGGAPSIMRRLAVLTPNGWALRGFTDLATGVDTWTAVRTPLFGMAAFTVLVGVAALAAGRRAVVR